jgi:hypothetical protein
VRVGTVLESTFKGFHAGTVLEFFLFSLSFHDGFINTSVRCLMKYVRGLVLFCDSLLAAVISHVSLLTSIVIFRCVSVVCNPVLRVHSYSITI